MDYHHSFKLALVTGGSSGIGLSVALKLASNSIQVVVADIMEPRQGHSNIVYIKCDVTSGADVDALHARLVSTVGMPDILVLNAGRGVHEKLIEGDPEKWQQVMDLNVMGVLRCIRSFVPIMYSRGSGHVVFMSSVSAGKPYTYGGVYAASKAAVNMIAETMRLETLPYIHTTVIEAGMTATDFFARRYDGTEEREMQSMAPDDVADDVWYAINKKGSAAVNKIVCRPPVQEF